MKKYFINFPGQKDGRPPFWMPWGGWGCLWRGLLCLLLLSILLFLLSLIRGCASQSQTPTYEDIPIAPRSGDRGFAPDTTSQGGGCLPPVVEDNEHFPPIHEDGKAPVPELPDDRDNLIPPYQDDDLEPGEDGRTRIGNKLNVLINNCSEELMAAWAHDFKNVYPDAGYAVIFYNPLTGFMQITVPAEDRESVKSEINSKMPEYDFKVFDESLFGSRRTVPNDPAYTHKELTWWQEDVQLYDAWDITMGDPNLLVGIVDSYFDLRHDEFKEKKIVAPYSIFRQNNNVMPPVGADEGMTNHGTHVACLAVGNANNGAGASGIAPNCGLIPVSVGIDGQNGITTLSQMEGIMYCLMKGAKVINLSIGASIDKKVQKVPIEEQVEVAKTMSKVEEDVWDYVFSAAEKHKCTIVWACGNDNVLAGLDESKRNHNTIRVSAVGHDFEKADFSNYGLIKEQNADYSTVSSPGVDIVSAAVNNRYLVWPGTSMAAPIVAGSVALMKSIDPGLSTKQIIRILQETGKPRPEEQHIGPLIQIKDALQRVKDGLMSYEEVIKDPSSIIGLWESTTSLHNTRTEEEVKIYMQFTSISTGSLYIIETEQGFKYVAGLKVRVSQDGITIKQTGNAYCNENNSYYNAYTYECLPGNDGTLNCNASGQSNDFHFNLRKCDDD